MEAAVQEGLCEHTYENGIVTVEAGCTTVGKMQYTCTKCGQTTTEIIPAKHTEGSVFNVETVTPVSCTQDGLLRYTCRDCGYVKEETVTAYHNDDSYYRYVSRNANVHSYTQRRETELTRENHLLQLTYTNTCTEDGYEMNACRFCEYAEQGEPVAARGHYLVSTGATEPTCTEPGHTGGACIRCDYVEEGEEIPPLGHDWGEPVVTEATCTKDGKSVHTCNRCGLEEVLETYPAKGHQYDENGVCTVCGANKPEYIPGDVTGDGRVTIRDVAAIRQYLAGKLTLTDEQLAAGDVTGDGRITIRDISYLRLYLAGKT